MLPVHDDLTAQHYQQHQNPQSHHQQYQGYGCTNTDFSSYGPMYSSYMKCRTNPYQRPNTSSSTPSSPNMTSLPSAAMYYPGFSNAASAAAAVAAGLYGRQHNMYDYATASGTMHHHAEVPRWSANQTLRIKQYYDDNIIPAVSFDFHQYQTEFY